MASVAKAFFLVLRCSDVVETLLRFVPDHRVVLTWSATGLGARDLLSLKRSDTIVLFARWDHHTREIERTVVVEESERVLREREEEDADAALWWSLQKHIFVDESD